MMKSKVRRPGRARRWIEYSLLLAGIVGVCLWVASNAIPALWQNWENWVFERDSQSETVASSPQRTTGSTIPMNGLIGRLVIPRLHLRAMVREGVGNNTLGLAAGHVPGTAFPWQRGNVAVAGHRDTLFRGLGGVLKNDLIQFDTLDTSYVYEVASTQIVDPQDVSVLKPDQDRELTLVTCYPFNYVGSAPQRFIVKAVEVYHVSSRQSRLQEPDAPDPNPSVDNVKGKVLSSRVDFNIAREHSRQLMPGISLGITATDPDRQQMNGWMWLMPDQRTVWLRDRGIRDPLVFYVYEDGKRRELVITRITPNSVTGYLQL
jgi:sortase A